MGEDKILQMKLKKSPNEEIMTDENLEKLGLKREDLVEKKV